MSDLDPKRLRELAELPFEERPGEANYSQAIAERAEAALGTGGPGT